MTVEVVVFPDAEAVAYTYLADALATRNDSATVATRVPNPRPDRLVKVSRAGGIRSNMVTDSAMLTFECWDVSGVDASDLARLVRALIWALPGQSVDGAWVRRCVEVGGLQSFPDPETSSPRYQFTAQLDLRGKAA